MPLAHRVARSPKRQNLQMSSKVPMIANHIATATIRKIMRMIKQGPWSGAFFRPLSPEIAGACCGTTDQAAEKVERQVPRELKFARNDKNKGLLTAHVKVRPFKASPSRLFCSPRLFQQPLKSCPDRNRSRLSATAYRMRPVAVHFSAGGGTISARRGSLRTSEKHSSL